MNSFALGVIQWALARLLNSAVLERIKQVVEEQLSSTKTNEEKHAAAKQAGYDLLVRLDVENRTNVTPTVPGTLLDIAVKVALLALRVRT